MYTMDNSFLTGNELVDKQHRQLFDAINNLIETCHQGKGKDELSRSLDFLNDYTIKHFFDEEQIQKGSKYPDYENHKKLHENFKAVVRDLKVKMIMKGASDDLITEVQSKIGDWLVVHIKGQDLLWAKHIKEQQGQK
jgi:hemerythrin